MELVTLAHVTLNRIGSASAAGMMMKRREVHEVREIPDESLQSLRELVLTIADENGEPRGNLHAMWQEKMWSHPHHQGAIAFNINGRNVVFGDPYAVCYAYPALKIGDRYFKLEEVKF